MLHSFLPLWALPPWPLPPWFVLGFVLYASIWVETTPATGGESAGVTRPGGDRGSEALRLVFVGDIMLDGGPGHAVSHGRDPFEKCGEILASADLAIGNLECVLGDQGEMQLKPYVFRGASRSPEFLRRHFDAVSLANNHTLDFGPAGLVGMLEILEGASVPYFGAGRDVTSSRRPLVLEARGKKVGLVGFNEFRSKNYAAGVAQPGNNPLVAEDLLADIALCRGEMGCEVVIPFLHWGNEIEDQPRPDQQALARRCIDAGATAVLGAHPHVVQTVDVHRGHPIVYSLGNFVFDYFPGDPEVWAGWIAELVVHAEGGVDLTVHAVHLDSMGIPSPIVPEP